VAPPGSFSTLLRGTVETLLRIQRLHHGLTNAQRRALWALRSRRFHRPGDRLLHEPAPDPRHTVCGLGYARRRLADGDRR
jgi:hypothetical protein